MRRPVEVHINELSVTGFDRAQAETLANALTNELSRLIRAQVSESAAGRWQTGSASDATGDPATVGRMVGQTIYRRLPR